MCLWYVLYVISLAWYCIRKFRVEFILTVWWIAKVNAVFYFHFLNMCVHQYEMPIVLWKYETNEDKPLQQLALLTSYIEKLCQYIVIRKRSWFKNGETLQFHEWDHESNSVPDMCPYFSSCSAWTCIPSCVCMVQLNLNLTKHASTMYLTWHVFHFTHVDACVCTWDQWCRNSLAEHSCMH